MKWLAPNLSATSVSATSRIALPEPGLECQDQRQGVLPTPLQLPAAPRWPAIAAAGAILLLGILSLSTLEDDPVLGARMGSLGEGLEAVTWVMGGGYAAEAGIRAGDVIRQVPPSPDSGAWAEVEVLQGSRAGQVVVFTRRWAQAIDLALCALGLEFLAAGVLVFLSARDRRAANRFAVVAAAAAATLVAFPAIGDGHPWALYLEWVGSKVGMAAFVLFFLTTPVERWIGLRHSLLLAPLPILAFYSYTAFLQPDLYGLAKLLGYSYMALGLVVSVAAMIWPFATRAPEAHRRLWPVLLGAAIAAALYLLGSLLPYVLFHRYLVPPEVAALSLGLIPLGLAWAMLRTPVMGMSLGPWALMRTVFDAITDPIFVVRRDGELVEASRSALELLGVGRTRKGREPFRQLATQLEAPQWGSAGLRSRLLQRVFAGETVHEEDLTLQLPDGRSLSMCLDATPVHDERGNVDLAVLTLHDVTARRELERHKDDFLASVSHDLRTPLTAIKYAAEVLMANEPPGLSGNHHRLLANIDLSANRMASMVEDLLELAHLQAGRIRLQLGRCDLREVATRSAMSVEPLLAARHQRLEMDLPPDPCPGTVDAARLERALTNLLGNAQRHGREGGAIRLSLEQRRGDGGPGVSPDVLFSVQDDGPGIPLAEQARIFEPFYRIPGRGTRTSGGSGLGLPIARAMVELHGGHLEVSSQEGAGATFWMALPLEPADTDLLEVE